jgi:hypothetical protein
MVDQLKQEDKSDGIENVTRILNRYKELITAVVFFIGGAIWIIDYFATVLFG